MCRALGGRKDLCGLQRYANICDNVFAHREVADHASIVSNDQDYTIAESSEGSLRKLPP